MQTINEIAINSERCDIFNRIDIFTIKWVKCKFNSPIAYVWKIIHKNLFTNSKLKMAVDRWLQ